MQQYRKGNTVYTEVQLRAYLATLTTVPETITPEFIISYGFEFYTLPEFIPAEIASASAGINSAQYTEIQVAKELAKADSVVKYLRDHTAAECVAYVQTNVTDLASAKDLLKKYAIILSVLAKQNLR